MLAALYLASSNTSSIDLSYFDTLPSPDAPTLYCTLLGVQCCAPTRVLMGEVVEREGRHSDAITWAQAELQVDSLFVATSFTSFLTSICLQNASNFNALSKTRAGRLLGRCHAALGEHTLSVAALDAALQLAKTGELMYSEALTVQERAQAGKAAAAAGASSIGSGLHWDEYTGKQQLVEVMGRMQGEKGLHEKLLLQ
jgi:hypothetical protein